MTTFQVNDMTCGHCVNAITQALNAADPGAAVRIDLAAHTVTVDSTRSTAAMLSEAIAEAGYTPVEVAGPAGGDATASARGGCCGGCGGH